jgi:hypothetical protein
MPGRQRKNRMNRLTKGQVWYMLGYLPGVPRACCRAGDPIGGELPFLDGPDRRYGCVHRSQRSGLL